MFVSQIFTNVLSEIVCYQSSDMAPISPLCSKTDDGVMIFLEFSFSLAHRNIYIQKVFNEIGQKSRQRPKKFPWS